MHNPTRFKDELPPLFPDKCYTDFRMYCHQKFVEHCEEVKLWENVQPAFNETSWIVGNKWNLRRRFKEEWAND